ncbi:hypothetical protein TRFO_15174 [Tritrichomonas foetus]|uniref:Uncharacterized protein n=1 Tax=Tritrichomonas foetus TaxID=1144522 RepID=A0A1J4KXS4_9EUKA|nr:hypothetical protein TRFO_15174 [Tritrichomonas foetus]|eukprot:OHT14502.1 hypothetical protein TRFO_15174 [Tritrichomonas foetus]
MKGKVSISNFLKWLQENKLTAITILMFTFALEMLLYFGYLPVYDTTPLTDKLSYFFPIWILMGLYCYGNLSILADKGKSMMSVEEKERMYIFPVENPLFINFLIELNNYFLIR